MNMHRQYFFILVCTLIFCASACTPTPDFTGLPTPMASSLPGKVTVTPALSPTITPTVTATPPPALGILLRVVYAKGGVIWLRDGMNSPKPLTRSRADPVTKSEERDWSPKISDDGLVIAFLREDGALWAVDVDGGHERMLASVGDLAVLSRSGSIAAWPRQFDFAPRSHDVFFNIQVATASMPRPEYNLAKINADAPVLQALLDDTQGGGQFVFSPDGKKIALPRNDKINVVNADGSGLKTVFTFPQVMTYSEFNYIPEIVWLPDGSGFKTVIPAPDQRANPSARTHLMFISADGKIVARLAEFTASPAFLNRPFISPDGSKVVYTKTQGANLELHIIDASTADKTYFSHAADTFGVLGWSPDSAHVVYWADDRSALWLGPQQGEAIALSDVPNVEEIIWVDAQHYFFVAHVYELRFRKLGQPSVLIDDGFDSSYESFFDFIAVD